MSTPENEIEATEVLTADADAVDAADVDVADTDVPDTDAIASGESGPEESGTAGEVPAEEPAEVDPVEELRKQLRRAPGDWYVIHSYAGYENKVKTNLETRVQNLDVGDYIFQVEVPTEEVTEIKNGQTKKVNRKVLPGYILVRMDLNDESWGAVRNTPGVTGFVGLTSRPSPLTIDEVLKFLAPPAAAKKPSAGKAAATPSRPRPPPRPPSSRSTSRSASRSPSWTARSRRCPPPSARSTPSSARSRSWCRSSVARPRSN